MIAIVCAWSLSTVILVLSTYLRRVSQRRGLVSIERLVGMILMTVAVQMFLTGET